jgi:beta-mannosidase
MELLSLKGNWRLTRVADDSTRPMAIPGDILSALIASGEAPDPYYDRNELSLQWIGREDWLIEREIEITSAHLSSERIFLDFEMLDTIAEIEVNGVLLGKGSNMFRPFRADAKPLLKEGSNHISVLIRSPERAAAEAAAALPYPLPCSIYPVSSPHRSLIRKAQCMAGWDWGPCLMTGGIYDGASLLAIDGPRIEYLTTSAQREDEATRPASEAWRLSVTVHLDCPAAGSVLLEASIAGASAAGTFELPAGSSSARLELLVRGVEAWWPAGYGAQALYELSVRASSVAAGSPEGASHEARERLGFRELKLVSEADEAGRSMLFRVNGRDVFCKGADWIPADALPSRWTRERIDGLLSSAIQANMNCLRVWGGGRYESEDFYELCDEKGILVWQDFMFACSLYPSDRAFLANVEAEVRHQVKRLMDHPCIALWCGNNEDLGTLRGALESAKDPIRCIVDYDRLNEGTIGRVVRELDPGRPWWPTSPCGGPDDFSDTWHADGRGDMHFWSVWHEGKSFSEYLRVKPRFCSEFGFQSFPNPGTVASFAPEGERNVTSPTMEHHQRHNRGNSIIMETMSRYFRMPAGERETLYLSQVQQALAIKTAVEYWRSLRPFCMGTIYWQLNDVWPVSSWSSLDYDGSWKLLHYEAKRFYESLHLALIMKDGEAIATAINDTAEAYEGRLELRLRGMGGEVITSFGAEARLAPDSAAELLRLAVKDLPCAPEEAFLEGRWVTVAAGGGTATASREALAFLAEPKRCTLPDPLLSASFEEGPEGTELKLRAEKPAFYVAPNAEGIAGRFEDSGFHLMPGEERTLAFKPASGVPAPSAKELETALCLMHLRASYE